MSPSLTAAAPSDGPSPPDAAWPGLPLLSSPWLWGVALAWGLYQLIPFAGEHRAFLERYLCGHPLEYVQSTLFCVAAVILVMKTLQFTFELQAAALPLPSLGENPDSRETAGAIQHVLAQLPRRLRTAWFAVRLADIAEFLRHRPTAAGLEDHAQRLAVSAADRHHDSHAQLQTIIWAIPILGFLGTVMGITLAIANVTPEQLDTSLNTVTAGLAVAFDTTAVALTQSILIVFAGFFVKRNEAALLQSIDDRIDRGLVLPLAGSSQQASPLHQAESQAAQELLSRTEILIQQQTGLWRDSVEGLRSRWTETLDSQRRDLAAALAHGVDGTLGDHARLLAQVRQEFVSAYETISRETLQQLAAARELHASQQSELRAQWEAAWSAIRQDLLAEREARGDESRRLLDGFAAQVDVAARRLASATEEITAQTVAVARQTELLTQVVSQEEQLTGLQQRLTENLEALRAAESLQETLHSLNAAIHLLTARARPKAA